MKFSASAKDLARALKAIGSAGIDNPKADPVQACVRIHAANDVVTLAALDAHGFATYARLAYASVSEDGVCAVNFKRLQKTVASAKKDAVEAVFRTVPKTLRAELAVGKTRIAMDIGDLDGPFADRLCIGTEPPDGEGVPFDAEAAKTALSLTLETAGRVGEYVAEYLAVEPSLGIIFASDGCHGVAVRGACAGLGAQFLVPRAALARALKLGTEGLELVLAKGDAGAIRALDGSAAVAYVVGKSRYEYPKIRNFLKLADIKGASVTVAGKDLRKLCDVLAPFVTTKESAGIMLHIVDGTCLAVRYDCGHGEAPTASTPSADFTIPARGELSARLSIHYRYLCDIAKAAGDGPVELRASGELYTARMGRVEHIVAPYGEPVWASQKSCLLEQNHW